MVYQYNGTVLNNKKKLIIHTTTWINLKIIMLSKRSQTKKIRTVCFYLYNVLENDHRYLITRSRWFSVCLGMRATRKSQKRGNGGAWENFGGCAKYAHYLLCADGFMTIYIYKFIKLYNLNICILLWQLYFDKATIKKYISNYDCGFTHIFLDFSQLLLHISKVCY